MKKLLLGSILLLVILFSACTDTTDTNVNTADSGEFIGATNRGGVIATFNGHNVYEAEFNYYFGLHIQSSYEQMGMFFEMMGIDLNTPEGITDFLADLEYQAWDFLLISEAIRQIAEHQFNLTFEYPALADVIPWGSYQAIRRINLYSQVFDLIYEQMMQEISGDGEASRAAVYQQAVDIIAQLNAGADFATLAQEHSECPSAFDGGLIDNFINVYGLDVYTGNSFFPEYVAAANMLTAVGQFTQEPVASHVGYHIIIANDLRTTFEDSVDTIIALHGDAIDVSEARAIYDADPTLWDSVLTSHILIRFDQMAGMVSEEDVAERLWDMIMEFIDNGDIVRHQEWVHFIEID